MNLKYTVAAAAISAGLALPAVAFGEPTQFPDSKTKRGDFGKCGQYSVKAYGLRATKVAPDANINTGHSVNLASHGFGEVAFGCKNGGEKVKSFTVTHGVRLVCATDQDSTYVGAFAAGALGFIFPAGATGAGQAVQTKPGKPYDVVLGDDKIKSAGKVAIDNDSGQGDDETRLDTNGCAVNMTGRYFTQIKIVTRGNVNRTITRTAWSPYTFTF